MKIKKVPSILLLEKKGLQNKMWFNDNMTRKSLDDGDDNDGKIQKKKFRLYKIFFYFIDLVFYFEIFDHLGNCTGKDKIYNYFKINIIDNYFFFYKEKLINIPLSFLYSKLSAIFKKKFMKKKSLL